MSKSRALKTLIEARAALPMPGVYDAFSARLAQQAGFQAVQVSGFAVAAAALGLPDIGILSLRDIIMGNGIVRMMNDHPDDKTAVVVVGRAHLPGVESELVEKHGYKRIK